MSSYNTTFHYGDGHDGYTPQMTEQPQEDYYGQSGSGVDDNVKYETHKNIKLLKNVLKQTGAQQEQPAQKSLQDKYDKTFNNAINWIKEPILMIIIFVLFHTDYLQDLIAQYLPSNYNNPANMVKFYGARGFIYVVMYYVVRNYKC